MRQLLEFRALLQLRVNRICFRFRLRDDLIGRRCRLPRCRSGRRSGDENLTQAYLFRASHLVLVLVVELLNLLLRYRDVAADFLLNDLLGKN